jgi:CDGSH-type Zn-finger protein
MARLIKREATGPIKVELEGAAKPAWICGCGLSSNQPYCDGSHKGALQEEEGKLYVYEDNDDEKARRVVRDVLTED